VVGRFASVDPLLGEDAGDRENPQRLGLYTYVRNNPIALVDPTGLIEMDPFKLAIKAKKAFWGVKEPKPAPSKNTGKYLKGDQWQSSKALNPTTDDVPGLAFGLIPAGQFGKYKEAVQSYRNLKRFNDVADAGDRGNDIDAGFATAGAFPFLGQGIGLGRIILALADRSGLLKDGGYTSNPTDPSMDAAKVGALKGEAHYRAVGKRETAWAGLLYDPDPNATLGELIEREERRRQPPTLGRNKPRARKSPADIGLEGIGEPGTIGE
jgi:hypothetical protein